MLTATPSDMLMDVLGEDFEKQIEPLLSSLYGASLRLTTNAQDAEDLVQQTVLKAWRAWDSFKPRNEHSLKAWLFKILRNTWISNYRKLSRRVEEVLAEGSDGFSLFEALTAACGSAEASYLEAIPSSEVKRALDQLNEDFRIAVLLCDVEGFSYQEISEITGVPVGTVMSRIHRGRKALQKSLLDYAIKHRLISADRAEIRSADKAENDGLHS